MIGIVLAGGQARRLGGGDKGRQTIGDVTIIQHVLRRLAVQCQGILLNANGDLDRFADLGVGVVPDEATGQPGPLAGVLAGLDYVASNHPNARFALTVTTDVPFLPTDLVARFTDAQESDKSLIVCARSQGQTHPLVALWSLSLRDDLRRALFDEGLSKVSAFVARHPFTYVDWPIAPYDPFFNVNSPDDLDAARRIHASLPASGQSTSR